MTAVAYAYVTCDHSPGGQQCPERIGGQTKAAVRRTASQRGWLTGVHHDGTKPRLGGPAVFDFCPSHKPAPKEG